MQLVVVLHILIFLNCHSGFCFLAVTFRALRQSVQPPLWPNIVELTTNQCDDFTLDTKGKKPKSILLNNRQIRMYSIRNKIELWTAQITGKLVMLLVSETKIGGTTSTSQFNPKLPKRWQTRTRLKCRQNYSNSRKYKILSSD